MGVCDALSRKHIKWGIGLLIGIALIILVVVLSRKEDVNQVEDEKTYTERWVYPPEATAKGAIVSNGGPCAAIGMKILKKYGNAVDSLIATMLCDGLTCMQNMGIGGGFIATLYIKSESKVVTINARESAPAAATFDMFINDTVAAREGGKAVAVPGEIKGYWEMYKKYGGKAPWKELFQGAITLCKEGVPVNRHLEKNMASYKEKIIESPWLRKLLLSDKGEMPKYGDKIKLPKLAETLEIISENPDALYNGPLTAGLVKDIQDAGGIITVEDMNSYNVRWEEPITMELLSKYNFYSVPSPGSGPILAFILKLLEDTLPKDEKEPETTSIITEAFKYAYAMRSWMGDPHFIDNSKILGMLNDTNYIKTVKKNLLLNHTSNNPKDYGSDYLTEDHGTANIVVIAPNGDAISATSTINLIFGSGLISESTGIFLNNEMDDFSTPGLVNYFGVSPSSENFIAPGKIPSSSMCPSLIIDKDGDVRLVVGAAGGTKITTATALATIWNLHYGKSVTDSVRKSRFHHQLMPMTWYYEPSIPEVLIKDMEKRGHNVTESKPNESCVTVISKKGNILGASSDMRRPGNTSYLLD
ncbi:glutathione hydrolase 1 proenzyme isoform X2 [Halyomorpha halys]|uniref:glutathione hydrolase 1 proenzyme isoform X2 n=1 Tax=Halyomorpha halys TaxID=286706 RepID=UPI0006D5011F|nr:glutathione hydrolase 1 proenzyme-like isoform X1 [Halyomorpha halys]